MTTSFAPLRPRLHDERPQVHVVAVNVRRPGNDVAGMHELLRLSAQFDAKH